MNKKLDAIKGIRLLVASLMAILGIVYLLMAVFFGPFLETVGIEMALVALVGLVYVAIGIGLFAGKRLFFYLGVIVPLIWASMGIIHYITQKPDPIEFPFIAAEIIVILCCCYLILHKTSS